MASPQPLYYLSYIAPQSTEFGDDWKEYVKSI